MEAGEAGPAPLPRGTCINERYYIVRRIGGGHKGWVYQARDSRQANRPCAVKEIVSGALADSQRARAVDDFTREAERLEALEHPSIPTIFDHFVEDDRYYLVMRYISGASLADEMRKRGGRVDESTVTRWAIQVCDALAYLHGQDPPVLVCNLKPANLMLDDKLDRIMVIDLGIARFVVPASEGVTATDIFGFAAPELYTGTVEPRSDLYSLGATMFHLLTSSDPGADPAAVLDFSKNPRPSQIDPAITPEMDAIIMKAVAKSPADRPGSALELMRTLEQHERWLTEPRSTAAAAAPPAAAPDAQQAAPAPSGTKTCPVCQTTNEADWPFCQQCGSRLPPPPQPAPPPSEPPAAVTPLPDFGQSPFGSPGTPHEQHRIPSVVEPLAPERVPEPPPTRARLRQIMAPDAESQTFDLLEPETIIGRAEGEIRFPQDGYMSNRHARVLQRNGRFFVVDEKSRNGTFIKIHEEIELQPGDEILIGGQHFRFETEPSDANEGRPRGQQPER